MAEVLEEKIQGLLATRRELADRLGNLEKLKAETNERVYKKIRKDYDDQLSDVLSKISDERGTLENKVTDLNSKIEEKEELYRQQSDKVDELQMRAKLKEFDENDSSFKSDLESAKQGRNDTADQLEALRSELADLNKVLKDVDSATVKGGADLDAEPELEEAAEPVEELEDLEDLDLTEDLELDEDVEGAKCPSCGHANPPQKLFCEECGSSLDEEEELDEDFDLIDDDLDL